MIKFEKNANIPFNTRENIMPFELGKFSLSKLAYKTGKSEMDIKR